MNANENTIIRTVPAASNLHKVPGFDPLLHLQRAVKDSGEPVFQLGLRYKRLWFRLACPNGRLLLNPLRITDQMAIFEAQVFFQREDPGPASSFTSTKTAQEDKSYIRAAQDEALSIALDNAGFGIQLCDVTQSADGCKPAPEASRAQASTAVTIRSAQEKPAATPTSISGAERQASVGQKAVNPAASVQPVQNAEKNPAPAQAVQQSAEILTAASGQPQQAAAVGAAVQRDTTAPAAVIDPVQDEAPVQTAAPSQQQTATEMADAAQTAGHPVMAATLQEPEPCSAQESSVVTVLHFPVQQTEPENGPVPVTETAAAASAISETAASPAYTEDMSIEDISARMTVDEARKVVVAAGTCKGWTLEQVAERRPSSLKFFVTPFCEATNIFKAAATLMLQEVGQQKAS